MARKGPKFSTGRDCQKKAPGGFGVKGMSSYFICYQSESSYDGGIVDTYIPSLMSLVLLSFHFLRQVNRLSLQKYNSISNHRSISYDDKHRDEEIFAIVSEKDRRDNPQQGDLRLSGPPSGQGAGGGARTRDRMVPADLRADSLATVPPTPPEEDMEKR
ncbi:hypothetical protein PoB_000043000 [Plakobranchus ocellatus]|uniref:Uncharacterized protein n=1 Tax=Plakobranchus ocellatus TaxID=259542 RepID=A0AAV3XS67_9GAST|nr:hypothetical protein PoB_000043000 [Plakobranchus ocellatus]